VIVSPALCISTSRGRSKSRLCSGSDSHVSEFGGGLSHPSWIDFLSAPSPRSSHSNRWDALTQRRAASLGSQGRVQSRGNRIRFRFYLYSMHRALGTSPLFRGCALEARCCYLKKSTYEEGIDKIVCYLLCFIYITPTRPWWAYSYTYLTFICGVVLWCVLLAVETNFCLNYQITTVIYGLIYYADSILISNDTSTTSLRGPHLITEATSCGGPRICRIIHTLCIYADATPKE